MKFLFIQKWHKKIGVYIAVFVIFLAFSGIALNHTEKFKLNTTYVKLDWLLDLYQISPPSEPIGYLSSNNWAIQIGERVYFNNREIANDVHKLIGMTKIQDTYVIAYDGKLTILTDEGELLESLGGAEGVPAGMKNLGTDEQENIVIESAHGYYQVNLDDLKWNEYDFLEAKWSLTSEITKSIKGNVLDQYRGTGLPIERVLLDLHSGRIFGIWGIYFVDLVAILFIVISITGIWMWWYKK
tara:strand:+ start:553 stop:1275 length:723 start_codon:yes stop_codon:yes gene_type:complete